MRERNGYKYQISGAFNFQGEYNHFDESAERKPEANNRDSHWTNKSDILLEECRAGKDTVE